MYSRQLQKCLAEIFLFVAVCLSFGQTEVEVLLNHTVTVGSVVSLIEGASVELNCTYPVPNASVRWQKVGDSSFVTNEPTLTLQNIQRSSAGEYRCVVDLSTGKEAEKTLTVNVLYQPSKPTITGPFKVLKHSNFELTCHADANPAATYKWTFEADPTSTLFQTGSVVTVEKIDTNDLWLYCHAQNTMFPTDGSPQTGTSYSYRQVQTQTKTFILDLNEQYEFEIGSILDVKCTAGGIPPPIFWWTKESDKEFMRSGDRLIEENVQANFTGVYACNVENIVKPTDGAEEMIHDIKPTVIRIVDPSKPEVCQNVTCKEQFQKPNICSASCDSSSGVIAVAVVGWVIAAIAFLVVVFLCLPCRRKTKGSDAEDSVRTTRIAASTPAQSTCTVNTILTNPRPKLPTRHVLTKKVSEPIYLELCADNLSDKNGAYDYVKATEERVSDVCEEPRPSPDGNDSSSEELGSNQQTEKYDWIEECTTDDNKTDFASSEPAQKNQLTDKTRRDSYEHPDLRVCNQVDDTKRRDSYEQPDIRRL